MVASIAICLLQRSQGSPVSLQALAAVAFNEVHFEKQGNDTLRFNEFYNHVIDKIDVNRFREEIKVILSRDFMKDPTRSVLDLKIIVLFAKKVKNNFRTFADNTFFHIDRYFSEIAKSFIDKRELEEAIEVVNLIIDQWEKTYVLKRIIYDCKEVKNLAKEEKTALLIPDQYQWDKRNALSSIAREYRYAGNLVESERVANSMPDSYLKSNELINIAIAYRNAGNLLEVTRVLQEAERVANSITSYDLKRDLLEDIAEEYRNAGNLAESERVINSMPDSGFCIIA